MVVVMDENNLLADYGRILFGYAGRGSLKYPDHEVPCSFRAAQLESGRNILVCYQANTTAFPWWDAPPLGFAGTCDDGSSLITIDLTQTNTLQDAELPAPSFVEAFFASQLSWRERSSAAEPKLVKVHFTNLDFFATRGDAFGKEYQRCRRLWLREGNSETEFLLTMTTEQDRVMRRLHTIRDTAVTACGLVGLPLKTDRDLETMVQALCCVFSVARGTKVQAVCFEYLGDDQTLLSREHHDRVTKPYSPMAIIDPRPGHHEDFVRFIEVGYRTFLEREVQYDLPVVIDGLLDAKLQEDFLEMRGAKLAVALETLKHALIRGLGVSSEYITNPETFAEALPKLIKGIRDAAVGAGLPTSQLGELFAEPKIAGLNRRSFRALLKQLGSSLNMDLDTGEVTAFIKSRDSLVHTGRFLCQHKPSEGKRPFEEFREDIHFVDRIFARLLGWDGTIIDWRHPTGDRQRSVLT